jgi:hypothetical protein
MAELLTFMIDREIVIVQLTFDYSTSMHLWKIYRDQLEA